LDTIDSYINYCRVQKNLNDKTVKAYRIDLTQYIGRAPGDDSSSREYVLAYMECLHGKYMPKTVKRKIASLKAFFGYCGDEGLIAANPFSRIKFKYREAFVLPKTISAGDVAGILHTAHCALQNLGPAAGRAGAALRDAVMLELLFSTGMRVSELCSLSKTDVDTGEYTVRIMGKGAKERLIQITNASVRGVLREYVDAMPKTGCKEEEPLFLNRNGKRITEQSVRTVVTKYGRMAGIEAHLTPHMFRHTFATLLLEEDVDIRYIQRLLGHSSIVTTQIYTHVTSEKQKQILETKHPRNKMRV
jgi:integrase/recombinase XerD